ncbi:MAG: hydantoinase/oxoprolinase family protein [Wenzhouxiangellaceae bacterium]
MSRSLHAQIPVVGVDTGGTFTDFFYPTDDGIKTLKLLSTPHDPGQAIVDGLRQLGLDQQPCLVIHGTTVGTNAVLEGKGAAVVYVTTAGFTDVLVIGRQQRRDIYALHPASRPCPVEPDNCITAPGRLNAAGEWLDQAPDSEALQDLREQLAQRKPQAVAINLIHGWLNPAAEQQLAACAPEDAYVACGSAVIAEAGEYERGIAAWLQASIGPVMRRYLRSLREQLPSAQISVMQSDGTTIAADQAAERAIHLLLSGPAGGVAAAAAISRATDNLPLLTFDMGGTSSDIALVVENPAMTSEGSIGPWPVPVPMVDLHTIGAGGGSLVWVDAGGLLRVGPASAGADPGPACYGRGGEQATITDAHVVLGRIPPDQQLAGDLPLDVAAAQTAVRHIAEQLDLSLEAAAVGIIRLANEEMGRALRVVTADRGHDPAACTLFSFGGAGGLHACELAELLGIRQILIAPHAGVLSALGMTAAAPGRRQVRGILRDLDQIEPEMLERMFADLERDASVALASEGVDPDRIRHQRWLGLRYPGQRMIIELPWNDKASTTADWANAFHESHQQRCQYVLDQQPELAQIELASHAPPQPPRLGEVSISHWSGDEVRVWQGRRWLDCPRYQRDELGDCAVSGPAVIAESDTTIWLASDWQAQLDEQGLLWLRRQQHE